MNMFSLIPTTMELEMGNCDGCLGCQGCEGCEGCNGSKVKPLPDPSGA